MKKQENNEQPCAHKHWYADPSDSTIFTRVGNKIIDWWTAGSKHSSVVEAKQKTPKESELSTFEHLINIDRFLRDLGMKGSVINKNDLEKFRVKNLKSPNGLIKDNVYSFEAKIQSKRISNILND
jgi:hypothetical protein